MGDQSSVVTDKEPCQPLLQGLQTRPFAAGDPKPPYNFLLVSGSSLWPFSLAILNQLSHSFLQREVVLVSKCVMAKRPRTTRSHP